MSRLTNTVLLLGIWVWLAGCTDSSDTQSKASGFAGLGLSGEGFASVSPDDQLSFPADHDMHPEYRIEWWYVTANLQDVQGREYGVQWTLFRQALSPDQAESGWQDGQAWMAHAAVTSADSHHHAERFGRSGGGQAGVRMAPGYFAWLDHWQLRHIARPGAESAPEDPFAHLEVQAQGDDFTFDLALQTRQSVVLQGDEGYSRKSDRGQASWYYSQPFYQANGTLTLAGGEMVTVTGEAWLDREWSSQPLAPEQTGWDWFSLHLASGAKVMLFRLRERADPDSFFAGTWINDDGSVRALQRSDIRMTPIEHTEVSGREVPTRWRLQVAVEQLDVQTQALNDQAWMGGSVPYWEGPVRVSGTHNGRGYLEMTGY